jgi:blue copper oxidase
MMNGNDRSSGIPFSGGIPLPIPPLLKILSPCQKKLSFTYRLKWVKRSFINGKETDTYGYNGSYPGPVIRVRKGDEVSIKIKNNLNEDTTVHWHGLEVDGENDGGPHSRMMPG